MAKPILMPMFGITMTEGTIVEWKVKEGDCVETGQVIMVIETEKVQNEVEAATSGFIHIIAEEGKTLPVGTVIGILVESQEELRGLQQGTPKGTGPVTTTLEEAPAISKSALADTREKEGVRISPVARKMAEEHSIDITKVIGTGPGGRIVREDIEKAIEAKKVTPAVSQPSAPAQALSVEEEEVRPLTTMRKIIAARMTESFQTPHFYLTVEVDCGELVKAREQLVPIIEKETGVRVTYTDFIIKMVARALEDNPAVNSSYADGSARLYKRVDIGMVTSVEGGLMVPVIRQANKKSFAEIAVARADLAKKARDRKLNKEEMTGSTFTISNMGMLGIGQFSAILQPPEAAILALGRMIDKPVVKGKQIVIATTMKLTLSIDHRVLDGADGARFLQSLKGYIECSDSKAFLEAGKRQLNGDTIREASSNEVSDLRNENEQLKQLVAELSLKNRALKKSLSGLE